MKIIDINAFVGPYHQPTRYRTPEGLIEHLDDYRIQSAVTWHSAGGLIPWQYNNEMIQIAAQSQGRIRPAVLLDPMLGARSLGGEGDLEQRLRALRPVAVRMQPKTQVYPLSAFFCDEILGTLNRLRLPLLLDAAEVPDLSIMPGLCADYPDMPVIVTRRYFNCTRTITPLLEKLDNFYMDMAILIDTGYLEELVDHRCGSAKLLFGSGLPLFEPSGGLAMVLYSSISDADKAAIFAGNWERLEGGIRYDHP